MEDSIELNDDEFDKKVRRGMKIKLIKPIQLARMLDVHRATIHRMEKRGDLPPRRQFSKRNFGWTEDDIMEWLESTKKDISNE